MTVQLLLIAGAGLGLLYLITKPIAESLEEIVEMKTSYDNNMDYMYSWRDWVYTPSENPADGAGEWFPGW